MKESVSRIIQAARISVLAAVFAAALQSCNMLGRPGDGSPGELRLLFAKGQEALTRSGFNLPDTSDFILSILDSAGEPVYQGAYGDCPESMELPSGSYSVSVMSEEFDKPEFSRPQFGDEQCVVVPAGGTACVSLVCAQVNSGIRLFIDPAFLAEYPDGVLLLKSSSGRLVYGYSEKRVAYFKPGDVSLVLNQGSSDQVLMTRTLKAREILQLKIGVASGGAPSWGASSSGEMKIAVDTTRNWLIGDLVIGEDESGGADVTDALTVAAALNSIGSEDVWVSGYIVGGDLTSSSASYEEPFASRTNLLLGPRSSTRDRSSCVSVQLPSGKLRDALNLVDNPHLLGRKVYLRGDIVEAYYGIPGIKNISDYELW